jgi:hypothetical protein
MLCSLTCTACISTSVFDLNQHRNCRSAHAPALKWFLVFLVGLLGVAIIRWVFLSASAFQVVVLHSSPDNFGSTNESDTHVLGAVRSRLMNRQPLRLPKLGRADGRGNWNQMLPRFTWKRESVHSWASSSILLVQELVGFIQKASMNDQIKAVAFSFFALRWVAYTSCVHECAARVLTWNINASNYTH